MTPNTRHRHRSRRTGSTARRYRPSQLQIRRDSSIGWPQILACAAVVAVAALLISLLWIVTQRAVQEQTAAQRERVETVLTAQAATLAEEVRHELLMVDQTLTVLQAAWAADSEHFNLREWAGRLPALAAVADDIFIADDHRIVAQDLLPNAVGQGIGTAYVNFAHGALEMLGNDAHDARTGELVLGGAVGASVESRQYLMYVIRRLDHPRDYIIGASYRSAALARLFAQAALGGNGATALLDLQRGSVQALAGPAARRPQTDLSNTPMLAAIKERPDSGTWVGPSGMDGVERIHAYRRVPGRELVVLVAMARGQAMEPAGLWAASARLLALLASLLVVAIAALVAWTIARLRRARRRARSEAHHRAKSERQEDELAAAGRRIELLGAQVAAIERASADGIATTDAALRLSGWNAPFAAACGLGERALRIGRPLTELLADQAAAGLFGPVAEPEAEITRRLAVLQSGAEAVVQAGPDATTLHLRGWPMPDGGLLLTLGRATQEAAVEW